MHECGARRCGIQDQGSRRESNMMGSPWRWLESSVTQRPSETTFSWSHMWTLSVYTPLSHLGRPAGMVYYDSVMLDMWAKNFMISLRDRMSISTTTLLANNESTFYEAIANHGTRQKWIKKTWNKKTVFLNFNQCDRILEKILLGSWSSVNFKSKPIFFVHFD